MPRIAICDSYYPEVLISWRFDTSSTYEAELQRLLSFHFGTSDSYSRGLTDSGWECLDVIGNAVSLQKLWARENDIGLRSCKEVAFQQIVNFSPAVLFLQDLSLFSADELKELAKTYLLAGQCSCPWPGDENVRQFKVLFTSFPHYISRFEALGVKGVYLPLAADPIVGPRLATQPRQYDCVFVGGIGSPQSHWKAGMETIYAVADGIPPARFYGYGYNRIPIKTSLATKYHGPAWGVDMFNILGQARVVLNRHGEVSEGFTNNLRNFEATMMGALLVTEASPNIRDFFAEDECVTYTSPADAVDKIRYYLEHSGEREAIALKGQQRTLSNHTYSRRMPIVSAVLKGLLNERVR